MLGLGSASGPIIAAIITLLGAAIIVPLITRQFFGHRLRVEVRPFQFEINRALKKALRESTDEKLRRHYEHGFWTTDYRGYTTITIKNISNKKITGVSLATERTADMSCQIDDTDEIIELGERPIVMGDVQPKHSRVMRVWSRGPMSEYYFSNLRSALRISADELDSVLWRFPLPYYLKTKYERRLLIASGVVVWAVILLDILHGYWR